MEGLTLEPQGSVLLVTIDRPPSNAFSAAMMEGLTSAIVAAAGDGETRFVRIRSNGAEFCLGRDRGGQKIEELRAEGSRIVEVGEACRTAPVVVVAEVQGDAAGFGVGLIAAADVAVTADDAEFWFPEILGGLAPTIVMSWLAADIGHKAAFDLVSTGRKFTAAEAAGFGIVTEAVSANSLGQRVDERLEALSEMSPAALRDIKAFLARVRSLDPAAAAQASIDPLVAGALRNAHDNL